MARQRTTPTTPEPRPVLPLPPHAVAFFTDYAELLQLFQRIVPLTNRLRRHIAGLDPATVLHFSTHYSVGDFNRMLSGVGWVGGKLDQEVFSAAASPALALAGEYREDPENTPEMAFAHNLMERRAHAELGIGDPNDTPKS